MRDWFESLESREKLFVGLGALIVAVTLLYGLVWAPLDKSHDTMATSVADAANFQLREINSGPINALDVQLRKNDRVVQVTYEPLPEGNYEFVVNAAGITARLNDFPLLCSPLSSESKPGAFRNCIDIVMPVSPIDALLRRATPAGLYQRAAPL